MHEINFRGKTREKIRFFAGSISAADDNDVRASEKRAVAGRASADAVPAVKFRFAFDARQLRRRARIFRLARACSSQAKIRPHHREIPENFPPRTSW